MKLHAMMIFVTDIQVAEDFYSKTLNFRIKSRSSRHLVFSHEGSDFLMFKCENKSEITEYGSSARSVFVFEVSSVDKSMSELRRKGVHFLHEKPAENEFCYYAAFADPFGNIHEICELKQETNQLFESA